MLGKSLNSATAEVLEVISDTEVWLKKEFGGESGKGTTKLLETIKVGNRQGVEYKILPHVDQAVMYGAVYEKLRQGGCIGIFPEGESFSAFHRLLSLHP
jgi:glycerol-3-phosphate O-acyltransferase/dihydroxyacetone phosphate acyltransferase